MQKPHRTFSLVFFVLLCNACTTYLGGAAQNGRIYYSYQKGFLFYSSGIVECVRTIQGLSCTDLDVSLVQQLPSAAPASVTEPSSLPQAPRAVDSRVPIVQQKGETTPATPSVNELPLGSQASVEAAMPTLMTLIGKRITFRVDGSLMTGRLLSISLKGVAVLESDDGASIRLSLASPVVQGVTP